MHLITWVRFVYDDWETLIRGEVTGRRTARGESGGGGGSGVVVAVLVLVVVYWSWCCEFMSVALMWEGIVSVAVVFQLP